MQNAGQDRSARQLAMLGILLQGLHVLFGITAIISVLVAHAKIRSTQGTVYYSHLRWQIATFWLALTGYGVGFYIWMTHQYPWVVLAVLAWVIYRLIINIYCWRSQIAIERLV